jgi:hypothetical protein
LARNYNVFNRQVNPWLWVAAFLLLAAVLPAGDGTSKYTGAIGDRVAEKFTPWPQPGETFKFNKEGRLIDRESDETEDG